MPNQFDSTVLPNVTDSYDLGSVAQRFRTVYADNIDINGGFIGSGMGGNITVVDGTVYTTIQAAITAAGATGAVLIPSNYAGIDTFTNSNKIPILDLRGVSKLRGKFLLTDFGGRADGIQITDAAIANGLKVLTSASALFTSGDVGKTVGVLGAGVAGAVLGTTIASYAAPNSVTLAAAASTTVTGATCVWGTDNATALQAAANALNTTVGGCLNIGSGTVCTSATITMPNTSWILEGNGATCSGIQSFPQTPTTNLLDLTNCNGPAKMIRDMQLLGPNTGTIGGTGVVLSGSNGIILDNVWLRGLAKGVDYTTSSLLQCVNTTAEFCTVGLNFNSAATESQISNFTGYKNTTDISLANADNTTFSAANLNFIGTQTIGLRIRGTGAQVSNLSAADSNPATGFTPKILDFDGCTGAIVTGFNIKGWAVTNAVIFENTALANILNGFYISGAATGLSLQSSSNNNSILNGAVTASTVADVATSGVTSVNIYNVAATLTSWAAITNYLTSVGNSDSVGTAPVTLQNASGNTKYALRIDTTNGNLNFDYNNGLWLNAMSITRAAGTVTIPNSINVTGTETFTTANGASWTYASISELITLSTSGTTTDSAANLLPANSIIEGVVARITTTIATATDWKLGDATTGGRFTAASGTLTAGTTTVGSVHLTTGIASATTGMFQTAAARLRITTTGTPSAGAIRVTVFYKTLQAPTS